MKSGAFWRRSRWFPLLYIVSSFQGRALHLGGLEGRFGGCAFGVNTGKHVFRTVCSIESICT